MESNIKRLVLIICLAGLMSISQNCVGQTVKVDFGGTAVATNWNLITNVDGSITNAIDENGDSTSINITITDRFGGTNTNGTTAPDPALNLPTEASSDSFYGNDVLFSGALEPTGQVVISGLDTLTSYEVSFFCSRATSENRETQYTLSGSKSDAETLYLNAGDNTSNMAISQPLVPNASGEIIVDVQKGPNNVNSSGFYYIGAMIVKNVIVPYNASIPDPPDGATDIPTNTQLSWNAPSAVINPEYIVYLNDNAFPKTSALTINPGQLTNGTTYTWRVDVVDPNDGNQVIHEGDDWEFTTIPATPIFSTQPQDQSIFPDENAIFSVEVIEPAGVSYQWYIGNNDPNSNRTPVVNNDRISGAQTSTLTITDIVQTDQVTYYCIATNNYGDTISDVASLLIKRLISHWPLDGNLNDIVGENDGTMTGRTPNFDTGIFNDALSFSGELDEWVEVGPVGVSGNAPRTITAWVKSSDNTIPEYTGIFGFGNPEGAAGTFFDFERVSSGYGLHQYNWQVSITPNLSIGEWVFLVGTHDGTTTRWYGNGELVGEAVRAIDTNDLVTMGKRPDYDNTYIGMVDDLKIYNYALSDIEVARIWTDEMGGYVCIGGYPAFDFNDDCIVDLNDLAMFISDWLSCNRYPECIE